MTPIDRWIELLRPEDDRGAIYLLYVMEKYGQISPAEAEEWRRRIEGWAHFFEIHRDAQPSD